MVAKMFYKLNTKIPTNMPRHCTVFLLPRRLTPSAIYCRPTVLVRTVRGKPRNFEANLRGLLYSTLKHLCNHMHFIKKKVTNNFYRPTRLIHHNVFPLSKLFLSQIHHMGSFSKHFSELCW